MPTLVAATPDWYAVLLVQDSDNPNMLERKKLPIVFWSIMGETCDVSGVVYSEHVFVLADTLPGFVGYVFEGVKIETTNTACP